VDYGRKLMGELVMMARFGDMKLAMRKQMAN